MIEDDKILFHYFQKKKTKTILIDVDEIDFISVKWGFLVQPKKWMFHSTNINLITEHGLEYCTLLVTIFLANLTVDRISYINERDCTKSKT